jgi:hypothetical protein
VITRDSLPLAPCSPTSFQVGSMLGGHNFYQESILCEVNINKSIGFESFDDEKLMCSKGKTTTMNYIHNLLVKVFFFSLQLFPQSSCQGFFFLINQSFTIFSSHNCMAPQYILVILQFLVGLNENPLLLLYNPIHFHCENFEENNSMIWSTRF